MEVAHTEQHVLVHVGDPTGGKENRLARDRLKLCKRISAVQQYYLRSTVNIYIYMFSVIGCALVEIGDPSEYKKTF